MSFEQVVLSSDSTPGSIFRMRWVSHSQHPPNSMPHEGILRTARGVHIPQGGRKPRQCGGSRSAVSMWRTTHECGAPPEIMQTAQWWYQVPSS